MDKALTEKTREEIKKLREELKTETRPTHIASINAMIMFRERRLKKDENVIKKLIKNTIKRLQHG